jgi:hypothetical protein
MGDERRERIDTGEADEKHPGGQINGLKCQGQKSNGGTGDKAVDKYLHSESAERRAEAGTPPQGWEFLTPSRSAYGQDSVSPCSKVVQRRTTLKELVDAGQRSWDMARGLFLLGRVDLFPTDGIA